MNKLLNRLKRFNWPKIFQKLFRFSILLLILLITGPTILHYSIKSSQKDLVFENINDVPNKRVAIVFGAGLSGKDIPSQILADRVQTAIDLYNNGKVEKIIMSGDNRFLDYDEPSAMINYALEKGIPESALQPDYAGRRTYDTCYRAKYIFNLDEAILITQEFHLTRALYICNSLDVDSIGIASDLSSYPNITQMQLRDIYALSLAMWDVNIRKPPVVLGETIEI